MVFDADKGDRGYVHDALGRLLPHPVRGNTHTGWVECCEMDERGSFIVRNDKIVRVTRRYLAPLSIEAEPSAVPAVHLEVRP